MSELEKLNKNKILICCFGGSALQMGGIPPFEFVNYLSIICKNTCDLLFYIDKHQCWYHKGIEGITNNIDETIKYLNNKTNCYKYEKIIFMGTSAGGYASILFGSLCSRVNYVIGFIPQTILENPIDNTYSDLHNIINTNTKYILFGDINITDKNDFHHILHCDNLQNFTNVTVIKKSGINLKELRDSGTIKNILDYIIYNS